MIANVLKRKESRLFLVLGAFFITNALMAEFIGVKLFSLEKTFGLDPANMTIFGYDQLSFNLTVGVLLWPVVFVMTDIINEYYGPKGVRMLSFLAVGMILYAFGMVYMGILTPPADIWITKATPDGPVNMHKAFNNVFGQSQWIIVGSVTAFLVGQFLDAITFHKIKQRTGEKMLWLRATGSTLISQMVDSLIVLFIANIGWKLELKHVLALCIVVYMYKFVVAIILTPVIYLVHVIIDHFYLGMARADQLKMEAMKVKFMET